MDGAGQPVRQPKVLGVHGQQRVRLQPVSVGSNVWDNICHAYITAHYATAGFPAVGGKNGERVYVTKLPAAAFFTCREMINRWISLVPS